MSRRRAREAAFQILYRIDISGGSVPQAVDELVADSDLPPKTVSFLKDLVGGCLRNQFAIDSLITRFAEDWTVARMPRVDRNLLRMAIFELIFLDDVPVGASVNEAVELAKLYGDKDSGRFLNGVLGTVVDHLEELKTEIGSRKTPIQPDR